MQQDSLIAVRRFATIAEARVACDYLTAHGVATLLMEQDQLRFDPLKPGKAPGVRVLVRDQDEAAARDLLDAVEDPKQAGEAPRKELSPKGQTG